MTLGQLKQAMRHADAFLTATNHVTTLVRDQGVNASDPAMADAKAAAEAFLTGTTTYVMPITRIDGSPIGSGVPGPFSLRLLADYTAHAAAGGDRR